MRKRRCVKRTPGSGGQKNGAVKRFQDQVVAAEGRTLGTGGQKNGAEKRFQDQVVAAKRKTLRWGGQKSGAEKRFQDQAVKGGQGKYHKMHFVHPPRCGHILYSLRLKHHHKSLANFLSCIIAYFYWSRSKQTLKTMWLHHNMHFVHSQRCGHTLYSFRIKHHYKSLANFMSCFIANLYWSRSRGTLKTM